MILWLKIRKGARTIGLIRDYSCSEKGALTTYALIASGDYESFLNFAAKLSFDYIP